MTQPNSTPKSLDAEFTLMSIKAADACMGNLRRVRDGLPKRLWVVALVTLCERAAFWGLTAPWQNYMEHRSNYHKDQAPGALGLGQAKATRIYCGFYVFYYFSPIFVAILADGRFGKFRTLVTSVVLYSLGIIVLITSSIPTNISRGWGVPGLAIAMFLIGLGGGGAKAILSAFIADQYTKVGPKLKTLNTGEQVVVDYELTLQYIYNLYYWMGNVGSLSWFATVFIEKRHGFAAAYSLPLGFMGVALMLLICGKPWYTEISSHDKFTVLEASRIITCAVRSGCKMCYATPAYQRECHQKIVSWNGYMVEELTRGLRGCRVLLSFVVFYVCFDQMQNNFISQAAQMKTNGIPNDVLPAFNQVGCIIIGPAIQLWLYPLLHRRRIYIGPVMRIAIGFGFVSLSMVYATGIQHAIYSTRPCSANPGECSSSTFIGSSLNVWLQLPIYFLISTGELFCVTTGLEFAYAHSPKDMKVIIQAISLLVAGIGSVIALSLSSVAHDPNLVILYASLAAAMALTTMTFYLLFRKYDYVNISSNAPGTPTQNIVDIEKDDYISRGQSFTTSGDCANNMSSNTPSCSSTTLVAKHTIPEDAMTRLQGSSDTTLIFTTTKDSSTEIDVHLQHRQIHLTTDVSKFTKAC